MKSARLVPALRVLVMVGLAQCEWQRLLLR